MSKPPRDAPHRVESPARMTVAEAMPTPQEPVMRVAEAAPPELVRDGGRDVTWIDPRGTFGTPDGRPWQPMTEAPQDGTLLEGRAADGTEFHMIWRRTSRHDGRRWVPVGFWSSHLSREPLKTEPVQFRLPEGFQLPGMIAS